ncbi:MAG: hypothetical protein Q8L86_04775 [Vicinamibacterales bacterium]|nr:hypothetical protein [Vicinamibacterales bacterium]
MHQNESLLTRPGTLTPDVALTWSSGFLATLAITTIMYVFPAVGLPQVDLPIYAARLFVGDALSAAVIGLGVHLVVGLAFAWVYVEWVEPRLAFGPGTSGLLFGVALWLLAQAVAVPLLGWIAYLVRDGSLVTPGFLSLRLGLGAALGSLAAHLAYGGTLGYVYGCRGGGRCRPE